MKISHVLFIFLLAFHLIELPLLQATEVVWDYSKDIIYYEGKLYYPHNDGENDSQNPNSNNPSPHNNKNNTTTENEEKIPKNNHGDGNKNGQAQGDNSHGHEEEELATGGKFWFCIFMIFILICGSGLFSGLTVGYLSIDDLILELRSKNGTDEEKKYAEKVLPILAKRHWLLVSLLLMNAICMEALPLYLDKIVPEILAIVLSVSLVLLFGEIIPQAYCCGPDQVKIAAFISPLTKFIMYFTYPVSYPISLLLDYLLGEHQASRFINNDLKALIELHTYNSLEKLKSEEHPDEEAYNKEKMGLIDEQANLMISALEMKDKKVIELMIPIRNTFMIDYDDTLDKFKLNLILDKGYSRIPVYANHNKNDIQGLLRIKQLIGIDIDRNKSLRQFGIELRKPIVISPTLSVFDLLKEFRKGKSHMAFITEQVEDLQNKFGLNAANSLADLSVMKNSLMGNELQKTKSYSGKNIKILGIITLEDVIEKMTNLDILDEDDYEDKLRNNSRRESNRENKNLLTNNHQINNNFIREENSSGSGISNKRSLKDYFIKKKKNTRRGSRSSRDDSYNDPLI